MKAIAFKRNLVIGVMVLSIVAFVVPSISGKTSSSKQVDVTFGSTPTVNGIISAGEYTDANSVTFVTSGGTCTVYFKHDGTILYVAFDVPNLDAYSAVQIFVDTDYDQATVPQPDDYRFTIARRPPPDECGENQGTGTTWTAWGPPVGWTGAHQDLASTWNAEFAIPYAKLGITAGVAETIGISFFNAWTSGLDGRWPAGATWMNPSTWGPASSSDNWAPNQPPTAFIDDIIPNPAEEGENVSFGGHGEDLDGYIDGYNWRSNIDGFLSDQASFSTSTLSPGTHTIYFKVQDNDGAWSEEVSETLEITPAANSMTVGAITIWADQFIDLGGGDFRAEGNIWIGDQAKDTKNFYLGAEAEVVFNINEGTVSSVVHTNVKLSALGIDYTVDIFASLLIDAQAGRVSFSGRLHYASDAIFQSSFSGACTLEVNQHEFYGRIEFDDSHFGSGTVGVHAGSWDLDGCPFMGISGDVNLTQPVIFTDLTVIDGEITIGVFPNTGIFRVGMTNAALEFQESGGAFGFDITGLITPPGVPSQGMIDVDLANLRVNVIEDIPIGLWEFAKENSSDVRPPASGSRRFCTDWTSLRKIDENKYTVDVYDEEGNKHQKLLLDIGMTIKGEEDYTDLNCNGRYDPGEPYEDENNNGMWDEGTNIELLDEFQNPVYNAYGHVTLDLTLVSYVHFTVAEAVLNINYDPDNPDHTVIELEASRGVKLGNIFEVALWDGELHLDFGTQQFSATGTLKLGVFSGVEITGDLLITLDPTIFTLHMTGSYQVLGVDFIATGSTMYLSQDPEVGFYSSCFLNAFDLLVAEAANGMKEQLVHGYFTTGFSIDGWHLAQLENRYRFSPGQCMTGIAVGKFCPIPGGCIRVKISYRICSFWEWWIVINGVYVRLACPANLHVYDSQGRHTGLNQSGGIDLEIPGSEFYFSQDSSMQLIFVPGLDLDVYTLEVEGESTGVINLDVLYPNTFDSKVYDFTFFDEPTQQGALHRVILDSTNTWTMYHDLDGDSVFENQTEPDSTAEATLDTTMVIITNVSSEILCANEANITWNTNVPATSEVLYRSEYDSVYTSVSDTTLTTSHTVLVDDILTTDTYYYIAVSIDTLGNIASFLEKNFKLEYVVGDVNVDGVIDIGDVVYLVGYLYRSGPAPTPEEAGDVNCDGVVNIGDVVYLVSYLYRGGPPPRC